MRWLKSLCYLAAIMFAALLHQSCCLGNRKCNQNNNTAAFRILSATTGTDMVFGPGKIYNKDSIRFFSLTGTDTIYHHYGASHNPNPGGDSLLYVSFDYRNFNVAYIRLNNSDVDTLNLDYKLMDGSSCCPDFKAVYPLSVNNRNIDRLTGGISVIKK